MTQFVMKRGDTRVALEASLSVNGAPLNLTGTTVYFYMRHINGGQKKVEGTQAVITDAVSGKVRYDWTPDNVDKDGIYDAEFRVQFSDGSFETFPGDGFIQVVIKPNLA